MITNKELFMNMCLQYIFDEHKDCDTKDMKLCVMTNEDNVETFIFMVSATQGNSRVMFAFRCNDDKKQHNFIFKNMLDNSETEDVEAVDGTGKHKQHKYYLSYKD